MLKYEVRDEQVHAESCFFDSRENEQTHVREQWGEGIVEIWDNWFEELVWFSWKNNDSVGVGGVRPEDIFHWF